MSRKNKNPWVSYEGSYEKLYYDIRVESDDGVVEHHQCYPNCGTFHTKSGEEIPEYMVTEFRQTFYPWD